VWTLLEDERRAHGTTIIFSTHYLSEAEPCDQVVLLAHGVVVAEGSPAALKAMVGGEVAEIEGPETEALLDALRGLGTVRMVVRTERGHRVGVDGPREPLAELVASLPGVSRFTIRASSLEDVYFERTEVVARRLMSKVAGGAM
jgi:ABC-2 type transport system ATP-binding protein